MADFCVQLNYPLRKPLSLEIVLIFTVFPGMSVLLPQAEGAAWLAAAGLQICFCSATLRTLYIDRDLVSHSSKASFILLSVS